MLVWNSSFGPLTHFICWPCWCCGYLKWYCSPMRATGNATYGACLLQWILVLKLTETIYQLHSAGSIRFYPVLSSSLFPHRIKKRGRSWLPDRNNQTLQTQVLWQTRSSEPSQAAQQHMLHGMYIFIIYSYIMLYLNIFQQVRNNSLMILPYFTIFYHIPKLFPVRTSTLSPPKHRAAPCCFTFRVSPATASSDCATAQAGVKSTSAISCRDESTAGMI